MRKLLSILAAVGLTATASSSVVACGSAKNKEPNVPNNTKPSDEKKDINSLGLNTALGKIRKNDAGTILNRFMVINSNSNLSISDLDVKSISQIGATIEAKDSSKKFAGKVFVTYDLMKDISKEVKVTNLGLIKLGDIVQPNADKKTEAILEALNDKNGLNILTTDVDINATEENMDATSATIETKDDGNFYGEIKVSFTCKWSLKESLKVTDLGNVLATDSKSIIKKVNSINPGLELVESDYTFANQDENSQKIIIKANPSGRFYDGNDQIELHYNLIPHIDKAIKVTDLGTLLLSTKQNESMPSSSEILSGINNANNSRLDKSDVKISNVSLSSALVSGDNNNKYQGSVKVNFICKWSLNETVKVKSIGKLKAVTLKSVVDAINDANNLDLQESDISLVSSTESTIKITSAPKSDYYGDMNLSYSLIPKTDKVVVNNNLGIIKLSTKDKEPIPNKREIMDAVNKSNPNLNLPEDDFKVDDITTTGASLVSITDKYQGNVVLKFSSKWSLKETIGNNNNIGKVDKLDLNTLIERIKSLNNGLDLTGKVTIADKDNENGTVKVSPLENSEYYAGSDVLIKYSIVPDISQVINKTELGKITDNKKGTVLAAINKLNNTDFDLSETSGKGLDIVIQDGAANVTPLNLMQYQGTVQVHFIVSQGDLDKVITNKSIGSIKDDSKEDIIKAINSKNPTLNLKTDDYEFVISKTTVKLTAKNSSPYMGTTIVNLRTNASLQKQVVSTDLGELDKPTQDQIAQKINELNSGVDIDTNDFNLGKITQSGINFSTSITATNNGNFFDSVNISWEDHDLSTLITNTDLGAIRNRYAGSVIGKINSIYNLHLTYDDIEVKVDNVDANDSSKMSATIATKNGSKYYVKGNMTVTYTTNAPLIYDFERDADNEGWGGNYFWSFKVAGINAASITKDDLTMTLVSGQELGSGLHYGNLEILTVSVSKDDPNEVKIKESGEGDDIQDYLDAFKISYHNDDAVAFTTHMDKDFTQDGIWSDAYLSNSGYAITATLHGAYDYDFPTVWDSDLMKDIKGRVYLHDSVTSSSNIESWGTIISGTNLTLRLNTPLTRTNYDRIITVQIDIKSDTAPREAAWYPLIIHISALI